MLRLVHFLIAMACLAGGFVFAADHTSTSWEFVARMQTPKSGVLAPIVRDGKAYVSAKKLCLAFGCSVRYQWAQHRAMIQNGRDRIGAVVSPLTQVALVEGNVIDFEDPILSDPSEGYLLPMGLASLLVTELKLGRIKQIDSVAEPVAAAPIPPSLKRIVIDPGHGGADAGTGFGTIFEKDVAYFYATALRDRLKALLPSIEVVLTRTDDRFVSLADRAKLANFGKADLFLSLHVNHATDARAEGAETYILSPDATDDESRKLALLENETWMKTARIDSSANTVKQILVDMEQTKYIQQSAVAAAFIQQELASLDRTRGLRNRGVKQAMFYVLSQVAMPSVLIEIGFLSSTGDRSRLMDVAFRDEFVNRVSTALKRYRDRGSVHAAIQEVSSK